MLLFSSKCFPDGSLQKKPQKNQLYSFETLWPDGGLNDLSFHVMLNVDT